MNKEKEIYDMTFRVSLLVGMATSLIMEMKTYSPISEHYKVDWFFDAVNAVFYENKPIPPMPGM